MEWVENDYTHPRHEEKEEADVRRYQLVVVMMVIGFVDSQFYSPISEISNVHVVNLFKYVPGQHKKVAHSFFF